MAAKPQNKNIARPSARLSRRRKCASGNSVSLRGNRVAGTMAFPNRVWEREIGYEGQGRQVATTVRLEERPGCVFQGRRRIRYRPRRRSTSKAREPEHAGHRTKNEGK